MTAVSALILVVYIVLSVIVCRYRKKHQGSCGILKSFLMPVLILFVIASLFSPWRFQLSGRAVPEVLFPGTNTWVLVILAISCGCLGDTFLEKDEKWYGAGLLSFLAGHLFYIAASAEQIKAGAGIYRPIFWVIIPYIPVLWYVTDKLFSKLTGMVRGAVLLYSAVIVCMSFSEWFRLGNVPAAAFVFGISGALLFMLSDTLLGFKTFLGMKRDGVMPAYTAAQALLCIGYLLAM